MYQVGERIVYGVHGVCCVVDLEERVVDRKRRTYLVLEPVGQEGFRYLIPTHNDAAMSKLRRMLDPAQLTALLQSPEIRCDSWIRDENLRKQTYREVIASGDRASQLKMVYTVYQHKASQLAVGKKVHQCDENFLRDSEKLLTSEVSIVLNMGNAEALAYLRAHLAN